MPALINDLAELSRPAALVLDDYHLIGDRHVNRGADWGTRARRAS